MFTISSIFQRAIFNISVQIISMYNFNVYINKIKVIGNNQTAHEDRNVYLIGRQRIVKQLPSEGNKIPCGIDTNYRITANSRQTCGSAGNTMQSSEPLLSLLKPCGSCCPVQQQRPIQLRIWTKTSLMNQKTL